MANKSTYISLVIGAGEIGKAVHEVVKACGESYIRDIHEVKTPKINVLHIAIPYSPKFTEIVSKYIEQYNPVITLVYSTVPIGTCEKISTSIIHSPVEGRHPNLAESLRKMPRWIGSQDQVALNFASAFWLQVVPTVRIMQSSAYTEMLKMRSTAKYGVNLVWADYEKHLSDLVGVEWGALKQFDEDYNYLYEVLGQPEYARYILDPPNGQIGGHCVVPNAELLDKQYPHPMLKMIKAMKVKKK